MSPPRLRLRQCLTAARSRLKWEEEQPWWFKEEVKARIPPEFLEGLGAKTHLQARSSLIDGDTSEFIRRAVKDVTPWNLDAPGLESWLESNWVELEDENETDGGEHARVRRGHAVQEALGPPPHDPSAQQTGANASRTQ